MTQRSFFIGSCCMLLLLVGCSPDRGNIGMMDHQRMDHGMMRPGGTVDYNETSTLLSGKNIDLSSLPEARTSETITVQDGDIIDLNPQIVKKTLVDPDTGNPYQSFAMYAYNGQFPGPLLKVKQGSTFTVRVKNGIDQPTTIHWHGVRLENRFDGAAGLTQEAIEPGDSFTYTVTVPDDGMYWYHPHVREDVQQDLGLYGGLLVTPQDEGAYPPVNREEVVFLDDILLGDNGIPLSYGKDDADHALMGRFGNTYVLNGIIRQRFDMQAVWDITERTVIRFAFVNAANARTFRLKIKDRRADRPIRLKVVLSDGGPVSAERFVESVTLSPSERVVVDVLFEESGTYDIVQAVSGQSEQGVATVNVLGASAPSVAAETFLQLRTHAVLPSADLIRAALSREPDASLHLSVKQQMMGEMGHGGMAMHHDTTVDGIEWGDPMPMMNAVATKANTQWKLIDGATKNENMDIRFAWKKGDKVKIRLINDSSKNGSDHPMQHPIHFHGQRFLVLSVNGQPNEYLSWKDTVLVPKDATVDILLDVTNPGDWMIHCHIAEHLSNGMMGMFTVSEP